MPSLTGDWVFAYGWSETPLALNRAGFCLRKPRAAERRGRAADRLGLRCRAAAGSWSPGSTARGRTAAAWSGRSRRGAQVRSVERRHRRCSRGRRTRPTGSCRGRARCVQRLPAGVEQVAERHRRVRGPRVVEHLRAEVLAEVGLVVDGPEVHPRQRRTRALGGVAAAVALADGGEELAVVSGVGLPGEREVAPVLGGEARTLGPERRAAGDRQVDRHVVGRGLADRGVIRGPVRRRICAGIGRVEAWASWPTRSWARSETRGETRGRWWRRARATRERRSWIATGDAAVLDDRDLRWVGRCGHRQGAGADRGEQAPGGQRGHAPGSEKSLRE